MTSLHTNTHRVTMTEEPDTLFRRHQGDDQAQYESDSDDLRDFAGAIFIAAVLSILVAVAAVYLLRT
jgi:hypothetical protein